MNIFTGNYGYSNFFNSTSLFSQNSGRNSGLGMESLLTDYKSIKTGAYGKLMKSYYQKNPAATTIAGKDNAKINKGASADTTEQIQKLKSTSSELAKSSSALYSASANSLYEKGNEDKLFKAVSSFVEDYNSAVKASGDSDNKKILRNASTMTNAVSVSSKLLGKAGITINSDNTLAIDEKAFKAADTSTVKTLFNGNRSLAYQTGTSASFINMYAGQDAAKSSGIYNGRGTYASSLSTGMLFDSMF